MMRGSKSAPAFVLGMAALAVGLLFTPWARAESPGVAEFPLRGYEGVGALTAGPGGVWFIRGPETIGRIDADGHVDEIPLSGSIVYRGDITIGPDGNFWVTTSTGLARITPAGEVTHFPVYGKQAEPGSIVAGPDGDLWLTMWIRTRKVEDVEEHTGPAYVVRVTPSGTVTKFELPGDAESRNAAPHAIVVGPDGNLWFTDPALGRIGRISTSGAIKVFDLDVEPYGLTAGPDRTLWFTAPGANAVGRITVAGRVREFSLRNFSATGIVRGPDGNLWLQAGRLVGRITPTGHVSWYPGIGGAGISDIASGPDAHIWASTQTHPIKGIFDAPIARVDPGIPGIEIVSTAAAMRRGQVKLELACGGSLTSGCSGTVEVMNGRSSLAEGRYSLPPEGTGKVTLLLSPRARARLMRERFLDAVASADAEGGLSAASPIVLRRRHPLHDAPRPGHPLQIPLPTGYGGWFIVKGPTGGLWLSGSVGRLTRITAGGALSVVRIPALERKTGAIAAGPGRAVWFLEENPWKVLDTTPLLGRIDPNGRFSEIALPAGPPAEDLAVGRDGNLWLTRAYLYSGEIDRVSPGGEITRYRNIREPSAITPGPGRSVWFAMTGPGIGRIKPDGSISSFKVPGRGFLNAITEGPDGNLWFTHWGRRGPPTIGRMTPRGRVAEFPLHKRGRPGSTPDSIVTGPDGNLWFTAYSPPRLGRISPRGTIKQWRLPALRGPSDIVVGPHGNLWFPEPRVDPTTIGVWATASGRFD